MILVLLLPTVGVVAVTEAGDRWRGGGVLKIGGVKLLVGYFEDDPWAPYYYRVLNRGVKDRLIVRTRSDIGENPDGGSHHPACWIADGHHYHGRSCPLLEALFECHGIDRFELGYLIDDAAPSPRVEPSHWVSRRCVAFPPNPATSR